MLKPKTAKTEDDDDDDEPRSPRDDGQTELTDSHFDDVISPAALPLDEVPELPKSGKYTYILKILYWT